MNNTTKRNTYESNNEMVCITTKTQGVLTARIHPAEDNDTMHKVCYSSDDYFYIPDTDIVSIEPLSYKKHRTKKGVNYWNEGTILKLSYIVETTKYDNDVRNDYSNITSKPLPNITDAISLMNLWQRQGFKNINITTCVENNQEQTIIEDCYNGAIELSINNDEMKSLIEDSKRLEEIEKENNLYKAFIKQFKADEIFKKFVNESLESNKDENGLYWYEMRLRPVSIGTQPNNFIEVDHDKGRHGIVAYDKQLTDNELSDYDMSKWVV